MKFGLAITITHKVEGKSKIIQSLSEDLKRHFHNRQYGADIKAYTIGIVCVSPQFEQFFKPKKPRYTKGVKVVNFDGIPITLEDSFEYLIRIDFDEFKNADEEMSKKILGREILASLTIFEKMKSKIKDFDISSFKADLEDYFKDQQLI
ncbi:hypothetical protein SAMN05421820_107169 [Pedobacter steynii]|uniref:Immunity protein 44 n=1 Tax=Pedobacter steynii TaxID=430522 RepID=A0A1H0AQN0_9SPHI|nr:hypothetical protein [Pedobacter steynii]NQX41290.1 hypothetical protein [Pedobacter steynii]SDN35701.1 hypothetical protein SAMN05421820_107169 [Pedobacter steynii]